MNPASYVTRFTRISAPRSSHFHPLPIRFQAPVARQSFFGAATQLRKSRHDALRFPQFRPHTTVSSPDPVYRDPKPLTDRSDATPDNDRTQTVDAYELTFTCRPCLTRSTHKISKQGYHKGSVLITCPNCKNRHVISDHLKIFGENDTDIEELLKQKGEQFRKGAIDNDGNIEFWDEEKSQQTPQLNSEAPSGGANDKATS